jgi:cytosine/adenosine deaminase-related metal-dependent hydrolase
MRLFERVQPLTIKGAEIYRSFTSRGKFELYTSDKVLDAPSLKAITIDLDGYTIFPGLINAHDHLELNHYPRTKFREVYSNAHEWGEDVNKRLDDSPFKELRAYPLWDKLFIGGLKNLLCGATTVAHHNPPHKELFRADFPVRVLQKYGWAHSLHFSSDDDIRASYHRTPPDVPWFIHLAEGTDEIAAGEYQRLKKLGCVGKNTVIVHGVGMTREDIEDAVHLLIRGLVLCPTTNQYLLQKTTDADIWGEVIDWGTYPGIGLGSDSRLTADGDLLNELRHYVWLPSVLSVATRVLGVQQDRGHLEVGAYADWIAIKKNEFSFSEFALRDIKRADLALIVRGGVPQIGSPDLMARFPHIKTVRATLDGVPKALNTDLARQIRKCKLKEKGLELL